MGIAVPKRRVVEDDAQPETAEELPLAKPRKRTPEEKRADKQRHREIVAEFHPELLPEEKPKDKPAKTKRTTLRRNCRLGVGKRTLQHKKPALGRHTMRQAQKFWVTSGQRKIEKGKRKAIAAKSMTPAAIERRRLDRIWAEKVKAIWGTCLITGDDGSGYWSLDAHHCWDKSIRPQWRHRVGNGIPLRRDIHQLADDWPDFHEACQLVADECMAAEDGRRPMPTRTEARHIIFARCPRIRERARPEPED